MIPGMAMQQPIRQAPVWDISVYLDNREVYLNESPVIEEGRTLVPLRDIFERLDVKLTWNGETQEIKGVKEEKEICLTIGDKNASINGELTELDVPAKIINGRTLVPLRFVSESLDLKVEWDSEKQRVDLYEKYAVIESIEQGVKVHEMEDVGLYAVKQHNKWGILNNEGKEIIPCIYDYIDTNPWSDLIEVKKDEKIGFVNFEGKEVIQCIYDCINEDFIYDYIAVIGDGKIGWVNKNGEEYWYKDTDVVPMGRSTLLRNTVKITEVGIAVKENGKWGLVNEKGEAITPFIYDSIWEDYIVDMAEKPEEKKELILVEKDGKWGYIDRTGKEIIPCIYDDRLEYYGRDRLAKSEKEGIVVFVDREGKEVRFEGYNIEESVEDIILVSKDGKYGCIDKDGNLIVECKYDEIKTNVFDGMIAVKTIEHLQSGVVEYTETVWKIFNKLGVEQLSLKNDEIESFNDELVVAMESRGRKRGLVDKKGNVVVPYEYDFMDDYAKSEKVLVVYGYLSGYGCIDRQGNVIVPCNSNYYIDSSQSGLKDGIIIVRDNETYDWKYAVYNEKGEIIVPFEYSSACYGEGMIGLSKDDKSGYVDVNGKEVIPFIYDEVTEFHNGIARVKKDGKYGYIDKTGKEVIPCVYSSC